MDDTRAETARRVPGADRSAAQLALSAAGIGVSIGSWSAMRDGSYFGNPLFAPAVPVVMVLVAAFLALVFRKREPEPQPFLGTLFVGAAVLVLVQLLAIPLVPILSELERFTLGIIATALEGISAALLTFLFLTPLAHRTPRCIAVTIATGYLLVHLYDALFLGASEGVRLAQRPIASVVMVALAAVLMHGMRNRNDMQKRGMESPGNGLASETRPQGRPETVASCVLFACFISVPLLVQGVYSQLTGLGSAGNIQEFNLFTELFAAGVRTAVLVYCLLRPQDLPLSRIAACASAICLVGIPVVDLSWGTGAYLIGSHIINSLRYLLLPLVTIAGVQVARRYPERATFLIFLVTATANSCYVSRFAATGLADMFQLDAASILPRVSLCALWVVACAIPVYLLVGQRLRTRGVSDAAGVPNADAPELQKPGEELGVLGARPNASETADPALVREILFYRRLERLSDRAQLTDREKEVLREVLHGYSVNGIADRLNLSTSTVKTYLSRAYNRFGVNSRQEILNLIDALDEKKEPLGQ